MEGSTRIVAILLSLVLSTCCTAASATEDGYFGAPIGITGPRAALTPPPGAYLALSTGYSRLGPLTDNAGDDAALDVEAWAVSESATLLYVYPLDVAGGRLYSSVSGSYIRGCANIQAPGVSNSNCRTGFGDMFADVLMYNRYFGVANAEAGQPYGLSFSGGLSATFSTGTWSEQDASPTGRGTTILMPNVALTYLSPHALPFADSTEWSTRIYYDISRQNSESRYRNGDVLVADFAVTQRTGLWQYGIAGTYAKQVGDDRAGDGSRPNNGNRLMDLGAGPYIARDIPSAGLSIQFKALIDLKSKNRVEQDTYMLALAFPL